MDRVVERVAAEARNVEAGAVAAPPRAEPLLSGHTVEGVRQSDRGMCEWGRDHGRILVPVALLEVVMGPAQTVRRRTGAGFGRADTFYSHDSGHLPAVGRTTPRHGDTESKATTSNPSGNGAALATS